MEWQKRKKRTTICGVLAVLLISLLSTACAGVGQTEGIDPPEIALGDTVIRDEVQETFGNLQLMGKELSGNCSMLFVGGRLYLPVAIFVSQSDLDIRRLDEGRALLRNGETYCLVNDLARAFDLWATFEDGGVQLFASQEDVCQEPLAAAVQDERSDTPAKEVACIRLEDITADPSPEGRFTHEKLEKIRTLGRWMDVRGQEYSIAWIPLFNDPGRDGENDLTKTFNFLNADFIYTLDYLADHGGHIGIHGLTHQDGDTVSGIGVEFGPDSTFSEQEVRERMRRALEIAQALRYQPKFFEFPHYAMTERQAMIAEEMFPIIYQQKPSRKLQGRMEWSERNGRWNLYVPTPADHVQSYYDKEGILNRIDGLEEGMLVSLFFHPSVDYDNITCTTDETGTRILSYSEDGILPAILKKVQSKGLEFGVAWKSS